MHQGVTRNSKYNKNTGRVNLDFNANAKLKIGISILNSRSNRNIVTNDDAVGGAFAGSHFYPSNMPVFKDDETYQRIFTIHHPLDTLDQAKIDIVTGRFLGTANTEYEFFTSTAFKIKF